MIRTAHAVRSLRSAGDRPEPVLVDELAQALPYWAAARYAPLPGDPTLLVAADRFRGRVDPPR